MSFLLWAFLTIFLACIAYLLYAAYRDAKYFRDRDVYYMGNTFVGLFRLIWLKLTIMESIVMGYEKVKDKKRKFGGAMQLGVPSYFVVDLDLTKQILLKDFDHFVDRRPFRSGSDQNKILGKMLIALEGDKWKAMRAKMTPTFTTGKIRRMFSILNASGKKMVNYLEEEIKISGGAVDLQESYSKYLMDVISSVSFGLDSKVFEQRDKSTFEQMAADLQFKFSIKEIIKITLAVVFPKLGDLLGITFMQPKAMDFFSSVIKSAIKYRDETKEQRDDFLQLMLEARAGQLKTDEAELSEFEKEAEILTKDQEKTSDGKSQTEVASNKMSIELEDDDIVAQSVLFILGGSDTTLSLLLFSAYNLALYPEIQEKVFQEAREAVEKEDGELTYDVVNSLPYLDMFINETSRLYPAAVAVERMCTKPYKIPDTEVIIPKGTMVSFPVYAFHRDAELYEDPLKFSPERFSSQNRANSHPCSFIPFGYGPRNCIAMRFALVETKMALAHLVLNFVLEPSEKTPIPMKYAQTQVLKPEGGMWLKFSSRQK